jgi:hypothetical protein
VEEGKGLGRGKERVGMGRKGREGEKVGRGGEGREVQREERRGRERRGGMRGGRWVGGVFFMLSGGIDATDNLSAKRLERLRK